MRACLCVCVCVCVKVFGAWVVAWHAPPGLRLAVLSKWACVFVRGRLRRAFISRLEPAASPSMKQTLRDHKYEYGGGGPDLYKTKVWEMVVGCRVSFEGEHAVN